MRHLLTALFTRNKSMFRVDVVDPDPLDTYSWGPRRYSLDPATYFQARKMAREIRRKDFRIRTTLVQVDS